MHIKNLPKEERPIEKAIRYGVDKLSSAELIAMIIHTGTKSKSAIELAEEIISNDEKGIRGLADCEIEELVRIDGVGTAKAARIMAAVELGKRISSKKMENQIYIQTSNDVVSLFMEDMRYLNKECFKTAILDAKGKIITIDTVSVGELTSTVVHPREVFSVAMRRSGAAIVVVHNHPSGDPEPSKEDISTTNRLVEVGHLVGIPVLDHIIIGDGKYVSFKSKGLL